MSNEENEKFRLEQLQSYKRDPNAPIEVIAEIIATIEVEEILM